MSSDGKSSIIDIPNALSTVLSLHGRRYTIDRNSTTDYGFVETELNSILPEMVKKGKDSSDLNEIRYGNITPFLVEAIKTLYNSGTVLSTGLYLVSDIKSIGTNGGTATAGSWVTRTLNNLASSGGTDVTVSANTIILTPGTYILDIFCPAYRTGFHQARLYNVTSSTIIKLGSSEFNDTSASSSSSVSTVLAIVSPSVTTTYRVEHRVAQTRNADGFGRASGFGTNEVYTQIKINKLS